MYTTSRLEWHLGDELVTTPQGSVWSCRTASESFDQFNRFAVALAKSQDHRASCGVFAFGLPNAVRQWLGKRYPVTRANQSRDGGRIPRAGWLKEAGIVQVRRHGSEGHSTERNPFYYGKAVLCSCNHQRTPMKTSNKEREQGRTLKKRAAEALKGMTDNEIADALKKGRSDFLFTEEWFVLKAQTIAKYGCTCMRCKKPIKRWSHINVDHIKPRKFFPQLANDITNLQILCGDCNKAKGNKHDTDYRP